MNEKFWSTVESLINSSKIVIDLPKGSSHPRYPSFIYPLDYGYLESTSSGDGNGIDVWVGSKKDKKLCAIVCTVDNIKRDMEAKIIIGCTKEELKNIIKFHNSSDNMVGILIERV